jgi:hypothetical protein
MLNFYFLFINLSLNKMENFLVLLLLLHYRCWRLNPGPMPAEHTLYHWGILPPQQTFVIGLFISSLLCWQKVNHVSSWNKRNCLFIFDAISEIGEVCQVLIIKTWTLCSWNTF